MQFSDAIVKLNVNIQFLFIEYGKSLESSVCRFIGIIILNYWRLKLNNCKKLRITNNKSYHSISALYFRWGGGWYAISRPVYAVINNISKVHRMMRACECFCNYRINNNSARRRLRLRWFTAALYISRSLERGTSWWIKIQRQENQNQQSEPPYSSHVMR